MIRGAEIALYRQIRTWKSSATQTQFGIFWTLNFPLTPSIEFWGIMRRKESQKKGRQWGNNRYKYKKGSSLLWTASKDNWRVNQPTNWPENLNWTTVLCLKPWRRKERAFVQGKLDTIIATLPQQWQQQRAHCWMLSWKVLPPKGRYCQHTKCAPVSSQWK